MIQFSEPMTLTTILETVKISVPFKNLLLLLALFSVSLMITRLVKFYNYTYSYIIIITLKPLFDKLFRFYFTKYCFIARPLLQLKLEIIYQGGHLHEENPVHRSG